MATRRSGVGAVGLVLSIFTSSALIGSEISLAHAAPPDAAAAPADGAEGDLSARADAYFRRGKQLVRENKLEEAYEAYRAGYVLKQGYDLAGNLGNVELALGKLRDAAEHLAFCLRNFPATASPQQRDFIQKRFDEARRQVSALAITVDAAGAEILVDGVVVGHAPLADEVYVSPGAHLVEARLARHSPAQARVSLNKGGVQALSFSLAPEAPPAVATPPSSSAPESPSPGVPPPSPLPNVAPPPAGASLGPQAPQTPQAPQAAPALRAPAPATSPLPPAPSHISRGVIIAGLSTAAVGLGVGVAGLIGSNVSAASAVSQRDALERRSGMGACLLPRNMDACADLDRAYLDRDALRIVSITGFAVAGGAALTTLVVAIATRARPEPHAAPARSEPSAAREISKARAAASPWVTLAPGQVSLGLRGRF